MGHIVVQLIILGVLLLTGTECQEYVTLNVPSRAPFVFPSTEQLSMDISEMHPVFLYASSQNDFIHQNRPNHVVSSIPKRSHQHQHSMPRPKFSNSPPPPVSQNQRNNNPRNSPQMTYGFQPKPSTNRQLNAHQRQKEFHHHQRKIQQNERFRGRRPQEPVYQAAIRQGNQHQSKKFSENIQVQSNVHQNRQNTHTVSGSNYQTSFSDFNAPFNYHSHGFTPEKQFSPQTPSYKRPSTNNQEYQSTSGGNQNPINNHSQRSQKVKEEHRQESVRKPETFENTAQAFKNRFNNNQVNEGNVPQNVANIYGIQTLPGRNQNNNERMNMQQHARSMRGDNKPQLPPRPSFSNGGIRINTLAGELPVLHFDSVTALDESPAIYLQNSNRHDHQSPTDEQEKKTYLLFKAPPLVTTERPLSAPYVVETLKQTSAPYIVKNFEETSLHVPEITYSTPAAPRTLPESDGSEAMVLDLVQIPDHATYDHKEKRFPQSVARPEFRSAYNEYEYAENIHPTESYPTTPMRTYDDFVHHINNGYSPIEDNVKYQEKVLSKPKIKESKKPANFTSLQPISYSSSVSVVSVKQSVDTKQPTAKKQKTTSKKAVPVKKKPKMPENEDYGYDYSDYGDQKNIPGEAGVDYPTHKDIPSTKFECSSNKSPGFYADTETGCQVFHNCDMGMAKHSFMCPNGTIFHQELFICDWWYNVKCEDSSEFYSLNSGLFITDNTHDESRMA